MATNNTNTAPAEFVTVYYGHNSTVTIPARDLAARFENHPIHSKMGFEVRPATPEEIAGVHREAAAAAFDRSAESFERCDTDGALSQWASQASGLKALAEADLAAAGGTDEFLGLFRRAGDGWELTDAKLASGQYGLYWKLPEGGFLNHPKRQATLRKKGYQVGVVRRPARVGQDIPFVGAAPTTYTYPVGSIAEAEVITDGSDSDRTDEV